MTMKTGTRVLLTIFLIVIICCFLYLLATMFGLVPSSSLEAVVATALRGGFWYKVAYAAICVVMIVVSFILMFFGIGKGEHGHESSITIAEMNGGDIVITTKAVEELIQREVLRTAGVRGAHTKVESHGDFVDVFVHLSVGPGQDIPAMTTDLQTKLQNDLLNQAGVKLRDMKLTVTDVSESMAKSTNKRDKKTPRVV